MHTFFFSRLQIPVASHKHFSSLARRLGRIFPHAYFHHREAFEQADVNPLFIPVFGLDRVIQTSPS